MFKLYDEYPLEAIKNVCLSVCTFHFQQPLVLQADVYYYRFWKKNEGKCYKEIRFYCEKAEEPPWSSKKYIYLIIILDCGLTSLQHIKIFHIATAKPRKT